MENLRGVDKRTIELAVGWFRDVWAAMTDDLGKAPSVSEFLALLTYTLRESGQNWTDEKQRSIGGLQELLWSGATPDVDGAKDDSVAVVSSKQSKKVLDELSDSVFTIAADGLAAFHRANKQLGLCSTLDELSLTMREALKNLFELLSGRAGDGNLELKIKKGMFPKAQPGDILAIPTPDGAFYYAIVITENRFGTALGFFCEPHLEADISMLRPDRRLKYILYTGNSLIKSARWRILGYQAELLALFPKEPEIFHSKRNVINAANPQIGPFGSAESPSGQLRALSAEEAAIVGLTSDQYHQLFLESFLETQLPLLMRSAEHR